MIEYYLIKRNLIISILFLIKHICIISRLVVYKKAYDIRRACRSVFRQQTFTQNHKNTNHRVYLFFIISVKLFEYYYLFLSREKRDIAITFVCLSVCLFVCLLAGFLINYWSDFDEIWRVGR